MNRKQKYILSTALLTLPLLFTGCQDDIDLTPGMKEDYGDNYFVLASIDAPMSRVSYNDVHSTFDDGDEVGVFALNEDGTTLYDGEPENVPYEVVTATLNAGGTERTYNVLEPKGKESLKKKLPKYLFYYPYKSGMTFEKIKNFEHSVATDQSEKEYYRDSDLLWTVEEAGTDRKTVEIVLDHAMANIIVTIDEVNFNPHDDDCASLHNVLTKANGVSLLSGKWDEIGKNEDRKIDRADGGYKADENSSADGIKMFRSSAVATGHEFRVAVPAQTLKPGKIISVKESDKRGGKTRTFTLKEPLEMRAGYNYRFRVSTRPVPIPEYEDDDSWVLDVLDPVTGKQVGLLCREYIRYQPQNTLPPGGDNNYRADQITYPFEVENQSQNYVDNLRGQTISSQAWVFYNMDKMRSCPDLTKGQILRVIYDARAKNSEVRNCVPAYPYPYTFDGQADDLNQGGAHAFYLTDHGHNWICDKENNNYGRSTSEDFDKDGQYLDQKYIDGSEKHQYYYEFWNRMNGKDPNNDNKEVENVYFTMHGSWIWWCPQHNLIYDFKLYDGERRSNSFAREYGHIAIPQNGEPPYVSFSCLDEEDKRYDEEGNKVGITFPHYLVDQRTSKDGKVEITRYPLVKIGYNQFWMSASLRTKYLDDADKTQLVDYSIHPDYTQQKIQNNWVYEAGYVRPWYATHSGDGSDVTERDTWDVEFLYNTAAIKQDGFTPKSIPGEDYKVPDRSDIEKLWKYIGWYAYGKLQSSSAIFQGKEDYKNKKPVYPKSSEEAYAKGFIFSNNGLCVNISGFNLKAVGFCKGETSDQWPDQGHEGHATSLLLKQSDKEKNDLFHVEFNNFQKNLKFDELNFDPSGANERGYIPTRLSSVFAPVRLFLSFDKAEKGCKGDCSTGQGRKRPSKESDAPSAIKRVSRSGDWYPSHDVYVEIVSD